MVYSTDRSKAVVPVLVLLFAALRFILRGDLFYVLPCVILFLCVFSPFSIVITSLREERANLSVFRTFVRFVLVCLFVFLFFFLFYFIFFFFFLCVFFVVVFFLLFFFLFFFVLFLCLFFFVFFLFFCCCCFFFFFFFFFFLVSVPLCVCEALRKHAYSSKLKISPPITESFQIKKKL